jgi:PAS domain-containing protein
VTARRRPPPDQPPLRQRLTDAERTIQALVSGQVDAVLDSASTSAVMLRNAQEDLRRLNQQLTRSEAHFRSVIENVTEIISILEADGTIRYISPSVRRVLGYDPGERVGRQS